MHYCNVSTNKNYPLKDTRPLPSIVLIFISFPSHYLLHGRHNRRAVAELNRGVKDTSQQLYGAMGTTAGPHLVASGEKADRKRLRQSLRQTESRTKEARRARRLYPNRAARAGAADGLCIRCILGSHTDDGH